MKQNKLKLIVTFIAMFAFSGLLKANEPQDVNKTFKVNKDGILKVSLMSGSITIASWDKMEVAVNVEGADEKEANQIKMNQSGNTITIDDQGGWGWSNDKDISIKVPVEFNAVVNTNSGDISIKDDLAGYFKAYSGGGDINTANITGSTNISTNGRDVTIGNIASDLDLSTKGVDVRVQNVSGKAEISTMGGSVKVGDVNNNLDISTFDGDIIVEIIC